MKNGIFGDTTIKTLWNGQSKNSNMENWKSIENYPDYQVSDKGRVKSLKNGEKILRPLIVSGYHVVKLSTNGQIWQAKIHRLVATAFISNPLNKPEVNHKDLNRANNNRSNLEWATHRENLEHAAMMGATLKGERNPSAILTLKQVGEIRERLSNGHYQKEIAKDYGVSRSTIGEIKRGANWNA